MAIKPNKMTNEQLIDAYEDQAMTVFDYENRDALHMVKHTTRTRAYERLDALKGEIVSRLDDKRTEELLASAMCWIVEHAYANDYDKFVKETFTKAEIEYYNLFLE